MLPHSPLRRSLLVRMAALGPVLFLGACARPAVTRSSVPLLPRSAPPWPSRHVLVLAYHDVEDTDPDPRFMSVRTDHLVEHFSWLRENGYEPVSVARLVQAQQGTVPLPAKPVLLTFDDGYASFLTRVLPLLKAFHWPAVLAPVGQWTDNPLADTVNFGGQAVPRSRFLTWPDIQAIHRSGLVEIAAHTNNLHYGTPGNPQGNLQPAAAVHRYLDKQRRYETGQEFSARLQSDGRAIADKIAHATGMRPRVWVWPYGEANGTAINALSREGYDLFFTLDWGLANLDTPHNLTRLLITRDPGVNEFAATLLEFEQRQTTRALLIDIDPLYHPDPAQSDKLLGMLVQYIADLNITTVYLDAFSAPAGPLAARAGYFPNRHIPVKADLFNRVAWQLRSRAGVKVYAHIPLTDLRGESGVLSHEQRLQVYDDLADRSVFAGVLFDATDVSGNPLRLAELREITKRIQQRRGPQVKSAVLVQQTGLFTEQERQVAGVDHLLFLDTPLPAGSDPDHAVQVVGTGAREPAEAAARLEALHRSGAQHLALYPQPLFPLPGLTDIRPALSHAWYPYHD